MNGSVFSLLLTFLNKKADRLVGQIIPVICVDGYTPRNTLQCNGALYNKVDYPLLWNKYLIGIKNKYYAWTSREADSEEDITVWTLSETPTTFSSDLMQGPLFGNSKASNAHYVISDNAVTGQITVRYIPDLDDPSTYTETVCFRNTALDEKDHILPTCSPAEYEAFINTYGQCPIWTVDTSSNQFRPPLIKDGSFLQQAMSSTELGKTYNAGLPNITGGFSSASVWPRNPKGALNFNITGSGGGQDGDGWDSRSADFTFDASLSNSIYGNSTTVQPIAITVRYFITI